MYKSEIITVTPKIAKKMIENNYKNNRKITKRMVDQYALDMSMGRWNVDACPPISIAEDGTLMDGQHRLYAVIQANVPIQMEVRKGVDKDSYVYFDCGRTKKVSDLINTPNRGNVTAVGRFRYELEHGKASLTSLLKSSGRSSRAEIVEYINENSEILLKWVNTGTCMRRSVRGSIIQYAYFLAIADFLGFELVDLFVEDFCKEGCESVTIGRCKRKIRSLNTSKSIPRARTTVEILLHTYKMFEEGKEVDRFYNASNTYDYYVDMIEEKREHEQTDKR